MMQRKPTLGRGLADLLGAAPAPGGAGGGGPLGRAPTAGGARGAFGG